MGGSTKNREGKLCSDCKRCCLNGDVKHLTQLLASGCKINARCEDGSTLLMLAASLGHVEIVDTLLLSWNPDVNSQDLRGNTALMLACKAGQWKCVQSLLYSWSADLDKRDSTGSSALILTASSLSNKAHLRCAKALLEQDADVNTKNDMGMTAMMYCGDSSEFGLLLLKMLVDAGGQIDTVDYDGEPLFLLAIRRGHLSILNYLLEFTDVNVNMTNNSWDNALVIALKSATDKDDKSKIVNRLIKAGSDPNSISGTGCSALNIAAASSFRNTIILLSNGAVPKPSQYCLCLTDDDYIHASLLQCGSIFTPLDVAVLNGQFSTANFLLNFIGCRPYSLFNMNDETPSYVISECAEPLLQAVLFITAMARKCPGWVSMVRSCIFQPKTLLQGCMGIISKLAGTSLGRHDRLIASGLPPLLVKKLFVLDFIEKDFFMESETDKSEIYTLLPSR